MSSRLQICTAEKLAQDPAANTAIHQSILDCLNQEAAADGWAGSAIGQYIILDGYVSITVVPADRPATIFDLRRFRDAQRAAKETWQ